MKKFLGVDVSEPAPEQSPRDLPTPGEDCVVVDPYMARGMPLTLRAAPAHPMDLDSSQDSDVHIKVEPAVKVEVTAGAANPLGRVGVTALAVDPGPAAMPHEDDEFPPGQRTPPSQYTDAQPRTPEAPAATLDKTALALAVSFSKLDGFANPISFWRLHGQRRS